jgi:hypothetical protein
MTSIYDFIEDVNEKLFRRTDNMTRVSADKLGLDIRAGYNLYIDEECIIVDRHYDRMLQYYGAFEYVDKEFRNEIGDYVIYTNGDDRVLNCLERYYDMEAEAEQ